MYFLCHMPVNIGPAYYPGIRPIGSRESESKGLFLSYPAFSKDIKAETVLLRPEKPEKNRL